MFYLMIILTQKLHKNEKYTDQKISVNEYFMVIINVYYKNHKHYKVFKSVAENIWVMLHVYLNHTKTNLCYMLRAKK